MTSANDEKSAVKVEKRGPCLGAEILGVDLTRPVPDSDFAIIEKAFIEHQILIFRNQDISLEQYTAFAARFGELSVHPFRSEDAGANKLSRTTRAEQRELIILDNDGGHPPHRTDQWHSDEMFRKTPAAATMLRATIIPEIGGDTIFASMIAAYEGLHPALRAFYDSLEALHDFKVFRSLYSVDYEGRKKVLEMEELYPNSTHPVVRIHPVSGRKAIFVSPQTTTRIKGVRDVESERILDMLYSLPEIPEYQFRVKWEPHQIIVWDNRSVQHYAPRDFLPHRRRMERYTIKGDRPFGPTSS